MIPVLRSIFEGLFPAFSVFIGLMLLVSLLMYVHREIGRLFDIPRSDEKQKRLIEALTYVVAEKRKNEFLPYDEPPEKPKRQQFRLGDDGELIPYDNPDNS